MLKSHFSPRVVAGDQTLGFSIWPGALPAQASVQLMENHCLPGPGDSPRPGQLGFRQLVKTIEY